MKYVVYNESQKVMFGHKRIDVAYEFALKYNIDNGKRHPKLGNAVMIYLCRKDKPVWLCWVVGEAKPYYELTPTQRYIISDILGR